MAANDGTSAVTLLDVLAKVAPGTPLRDGLERILRGRTGAIIVLGWDRQVENVVNGGFVLDVEYSAARLRELTKMDGAIVLDGDSLQITRAAVQLMPDPTLPTEETGTRHRTADRVSRQTTRPVISVSKSMNIIALYLHGRRYVLEDSAATLSRANQALNTLERYKQRLDEVARSLSALEIEDVATVREVCATLQRLEMVRHIASEIRAYLLELGTEGRLVSLQLAELVAGVDTDRELVVRDYLVPRSGRKHRTEASALEALDVLGPADLLDLTAVARALGFPSGTDALEENVTPRGHRLLSRVPRLPEVVRTRLVDHFGSLQALLGASIDDLQEVEGIGENRARFIREGLSRLAESSLLERYV